MKIYSNFLDGSSFMNEINKHPDLKDKPITVFIDFIPKSIEQLKENPFNILLIMEPNQLFGLHDWAVANANHFSCILTWSDKILNSYENSYLFPFGVTWLDEEYINNSHTINKNYQVSFLCGAKKRIEGHFLRHRLYDRKDEILIPKQWHYTLNDYDPDNGNHKIIKYENQCPGVEKKKLWNDMFSICIENSSNNGYFTEKILDAFLSYTIPIYWGCPDIGNYFNIDGVILCKDENEIIEKTNKLTSEYYNSRLDVMKQNFELAREYANIQKRFIDILKEILKHNDIK